MKKSRKILLRILMLSFMIVFGVFWPSTRSGDGSHNSENNQISDSNIVSDYNTENYSEELYTQENIGDIYDIEIESRIDEIIEQMTMEEKVGQLFFIKNDNRFDESIIEQYPVGGIILFSGDFSGKTPEQLKEELEKFQSNSKIPLLIGTDEEGGSVVRLSKFAALANKTFESPANLYAAGGIERIKEDTTEKSRLLLSYGINVNFAPVCDISVNSGEYMYNRSLGKSPIETAEYVSAVINIMNEEGIGSVLKHFPGYGGNGDTHDNIVRDKRDYSNFEKYDFVPFKAGIMEGAQCVLISHNIVECMDDEWPASMSVKVHNILRDDLNFKGVIITDDLMMKGVSSFINEEEAVVRAVTAGNDMILVTDYAKSYSTLLKAVESGEISIDRIEMSLRKILKWKIELGLYE